LFQEEPLAEQIMKILKDKEIVDTLFVSGGIVLGAFFSYLLQFFLGRLLSVEDYGSFNALLSLSVLLGVPAIIFGAPLIKIVSELFALGRKSYLSKLFMTLVVFSMLLGTVAAVGIFLFRNYISASLKLNNPFVVIFFGIGFIFTYTSPIFVSYLQGVMKYKVFIFYSVLNSIFRFFMIVALVLKGGGLNSVFIGSLVASVVSTLLGLLLVREFVGLPSNEDISDYLKKMLKLGFYSLFLYTGLNFLNNVDVVLVKSLFDGTHAGYYAAVVTVGKILLFGAGSVTVVMFPKVSALYAKKENYRPVFNKLFILQLLVVGFGVAIYAVFSKYIVTLLFGPRFEHAIEYLPLFSVFMGLYVVINFLLMFLLAIEKMHLTYILIPVVLLQYSLISFYHANLYQVIYSNILACSVALILLFFHSIKPSD